MYTITAAFGVWHRGTSEWRFISHARRVQTTVDHVTAHTPDTGHVVLWSRYSTVCALPKLEAITLCSRIASEREISRCIRRVIRRDFDFRSTCPCLVYHYLLHGIFAFSG